MDGICDGVDPAAELTRQPDTPALRVNLKTTMSDIQTNGLSRRHLKAPRSRLVMAAW